jgi:hypothetical protein
VKIERLAWKQRPWFWPWGLIPTGKFGKLLKERFLNFFLSVIALSLGGPEKRSMRVLPRP